MSQLTLPAVAKSLYTFCKKCDADRYHRVLAHVSSTSAKIECEICKSRKTYSLPKTLDKKTVIKRTVGSGSSAGTSRKSTNHTGDYELYVQKYQDNQATPFSIKAQFKDNQKIDHVKFGIGFVIKTYTDKIDVIFKDEVKSLIHNKN